MPEIIRLGDPTSHDGRVVEGSMTDICHGKPIAFIGHKVHCPKCKGTYPIVEGVLTTNFYGKGVAVAGMKTSCGATLIATQFTDTVEWSSGALSATTKATSSLVAVAAGAQSIQQSNHDASPFDEQSQLPSQVSDGLPFLIVAPDGQRLSGNVDAGGKLPRVATDGEGEYIVYWGDEALARMET
jgi:uncharacterized Zn-binding protein involved in type VI secretion